MAAKQHEPTSNEVVWISHRDDATCGKCGKEIGRGQFVQVNRRDGVRCVSCAGYSELCFLPAGDAGLTRLATGLSQRVVVVVKWSSARKRHERQGILVDEPAYDAALQQAEAASRRGQSRFRVLEMDGEKVLWKQ
jgi:hypothetical protein